MTTTTTTRPTLDTNPSNANEMPRGFLCLGCSVGKAQSRFLTILRMPAALLNALAPHLYSMPCILHPIVTPGPCICMAMCRFMTLTYTTPAHALQTAPGASTITPTTIGCAPHNLHSEQRTRKHLRCITGECSARYTAAHYNPWPACDRVVT